jgi:hypothetical protein
MGKPNGAVSSKGNSRSIQEEAQLRTDEVVFVSHGDLLRLALRCHCHGIHSEAILALCRPENNFWVFKATVFKSSRCRGFVGYGNVSPLIFNNAEMRMAETRAVNRALRKAYGIGLCSLGELPPWRLSPEQLPVLRRTLQSRSSFQKGVTHANENSRSQSAERKNPPRRRRVSSPGRALRTSRPRP